MSQQMQKIAVQSPTSHGLIQNQNHGQHVS
jgi:hypothetical protein